MKLYELKHSRLKKWAEDAIELMQPDDVYVCDGLKAEYDWLAEQRRSKKDWLSD